MQKRRNKTPMLPGLAWCALALWFGGASASAAPAADDLFQTGYLRDETSDGLNRNQVFFRYRNHRREMFWPWEDAADTSLDWGVDARHDTGDVPGRSFDATRVAGLLGKRFARSLYVQATAGVHRLDAGPRQELAIYSADIYWSPLAALDLHLAGDRDFLYDEAVIPAGITQALTAKTYSGAALWKPGRRWRVNAQAATRDFDDGNRSREYEYSAMYGISPDWPWIWVGVGGESLRFDEQRPGYWTPRHYRSFGLRLDSAVPLTQRLELSAAVNVDRLREDGASGNGHYVDVGLDWTFSGDLHLRLDATRNVSIQQGARWSEDIYQLSFAGPLP